MRLNWESSSIWHKLCRYWALRKDRALSGYLRNSRRTRRNGESDSALASSWESCWKYIPLRPFSNTWSLFSLNFVLTPFPLSEKKLLARLEPLSRSWARLKAWGSASSRVWRLSVHPQNIPKDKRKFCIYFRFLIMCEQLMRQKNLFEE